MFHAQLAVKEMGRVLDIASSHYNYISVAMGEGNRIFIWGECLGQIITVPTLVTEASLHDVFARYASPSVMHQPLVLYGEELEMSLTDCFRNAFDDQVRIYKAKKSIYKHISHFLEIISLSFIEYEWSCSTSTTKMYLCAQSSFNDTLSILSNDVSTKFNLV